MVIQSSNSKSNVQINLTEFSDLITSYTADFVGREWLVKQVNTLLGDPDCRFVVLTGGPGVGKTAFLAHLAATYPQWPRYFIRRDSRDLLRPGDANTFLLTIGGQLATLYPHLFKPKNLEVTVRQRIGSVKIDGEAIAARIQELHVSPFYSVALQVEQEIQQVAGKAAALEIGRLVSNARLLQMQDLQYLGLLDPARLLAQTDPEMRIVVLIDALDELRYSPAELDILRVLRELPEIPPNLRFVVSSRPEKFLDRLLVRNDVRELPLDITRADNWADLQAYALDALGDNGLSTALIEEGIRLDVFTNRLLEKAAGNFLYLKSVLSGIQETLVDPAKQERLHRLLHVEELPDDLGALYGYFLASIVDWAERREFGEATWRMYLKPLLGILAVAQEPLSEEQLLNFTKLRRTDIRDLLRELRQFVESINGGRMTYRIYHTSFAEYLFDDERNYDYLVDKQEGHERIADHYLDVWEGLESKLIGLQEPEKRDVDRGYGLRHLVTHLDGANRTNDLHHVLKLEWQSGERWENIWYAIQEAAGNTQGYLADVARAWRLAEEGGLTSPQLQGWPIKVGQHADIGLQCRYALVTTSLNSLAKNISPVLLVSLVEKEVWVPAQGLAYARQVPDSLQRLEALTRLTPYLPNAERDQTQKEVLMALHEIKNEQVQVNILQILVSHLSPQLTNEALKIIQEVNDKETQVHLLARMATRLVQVGQPENALAIVQSIQDENWRSKTLLELIPNLPEPLQLKVLTMARGMWRDNRARTLAGLIAYLATPLKEEVLREVRKAAQGIWSSEVQAEVSTNLARHIPEPMKDQMLREALQSARKINNQKNRIEALARLVPHLPEPEREQIFSEVLATIKIVTEEGATVQILSEMATLLAAMEHPAEALRVVQSVRHEQRRIELSATLIPHLSEPLKNEVLEKTLAATRSIADKHSKVEALSFLIPHLLEPLKTEILKEALVTVRSIMNVKCRDYALTALIPHLPKPLLQDVLAMVRVIKDNDELTQLLKILESQTSLSHPETTLKEAQYPGHKNARTYMLPELKSRLAKFWDRFKLKPLINEPTSGLEARLAKFKSPEEIQETIRKKQQLDENARRPKKLEAWPVELESQEGIEDVVWKIQKLQKYDKDRAEALVRLVFHSSQMLKDEVFDVNKALRKAYRIEVERNFVKVLVGLAPRLSELQKVQIQQEIIAALQTFDINSHLIEVLVWLASRVPDPLKDQVLQEVLTITQAIEDKKKRVEILIWLLLHLPESFTGKVLWEVIAAVRACDDEDWQVEIITGLAPYLTESLLQQALLIAQQIKQNLMQAKTLLQLAPYLPEPQQPEVLRVALVITLTAENISLERTEIMTDLIHQIAGLSPAPMYALWREALHTLAVYTRPKLVQDLQAMTSVITALGGTEAVEETLCGIQDVARWWP